MGPKFNNIVTKFVVKILPSIIGDLYYKSINNIVKIICGKATTLSNALFGGGHFHIGIILNPTLYSTLSQTVYAETNDPVTAPKIPVTVSVADLSKHRHQNTVAMWVYENPVNIYAYIKTMAVDAVDYCYLVEQRKR